MNVLLDRFSSAVPEIIRSLTEYGHDVRHVTTLNGIELDISKFDNCTFETDFDVIKNASNNMVDWVLEAELVEKLAQNEGRFITLSSRYAISPKVWSAQDISEIYYFLCNYWHIILKTKKIDAIFSMYVPHEPSSFSLYILAKTLKIPYIFVDPATIGGRLKFLSCSVKHRDLLIAKEQASEEIKSHLRDYLSRLKDDFTSQAPPFMTKVYRENHLPVAFSILADFTIIFRAFIRDLFFKKSTMPALGFFKIRRLLWGKKKAHFNFHTSFAIFAMLQNIRLYLEKRRYEKLCTSSLPNKFIYFSAPLEPEASNQPLSGNYKHLRILLSMLNNSITDDTKIVFKINPAQFTGRAAPNSTFVKWLPDDFYSNLKKLDKLILITADAYSTEELIDRSKCVAAVNGTVAIEAIARSKHCITFASMWFDQFTGVHKCLSTEDVTRTLGMLDNKMDPESELETLHFSKSSSFFISTFVANDFVSKDMQGLVEAFDSSLSVFSELSDEKWEV